MKQIYKEELAKLAYNEMAEAVMCDYWVRPEDCYNVPEVLEWIDERCAYRLARIKRQLTSEEVTDIIDKTADLVAAIYF